MESKTRNELCALVQSKLQDNGKCTHVSFVGTCRWGREPVKTVGSSMNWVATDEITNVSTVSTTEESLQCRLHVVFS